MGPGLQNAYKNHSAIFKNGYMPRKKFYGEINMGYNEFNKVRFLYCGTAKPLISHGHCEGGMS